MNRIVCGQCGNSENIEVSVTLLEPLKDGKDGTNSRKASVSPDCTLKCEECQHIGVARLDQFKDGVTF